jgi:NAD(P)-dependent dehydrogenase (short-subunit alcohol dehydrogenase family)
VSNLSGRRALVTGGSRGIGFAIADALLSDGATCTIMSRSAITDPLVRERFRAHGDRIHFVEGDVTKQEECQAAIDRAVALMGGLEILVNCAGRLAGTRPDRAMSADEADILADFDEKVLGTLRMVRAARAPLSESGTGRVINIGGAGARQAGNISSGARNAALVHLSRSLAMDFGIDGITVNTIHPGLTLTDTVIERLTESSGDKPVDELIAKLASKNAIRRLIKPEDIGAVAAFLASESSGGLTGEVLAVTGGSTDAVYY